MTLKNYLKNKKILEEANVSITDHDACGVGFVASMTGKPKREVVENGIEALKAVWHRGAVDADGKTGDGAGIHIEFSREFFEEQISVTGHKIQENQEINSLIIFFILFIIRHGMQFTKHEKLEKFIDGH